MSFYKLSERKRRVNDYEAFASFVFSYGSQAFGLNIQLRFFSFNVCFLVSLFNSTLYSVFISVYGLQE